MNKSKMNKSKIIPDVHTFLNNRIFIALLILFFILIPTSAHANSMEGLIVFVAAPIVTLISIFIKSLYLIARDSNRFSLSGKLFLAYFWESILLLGMFLVAPTDINPNANLTVLVRVIPWLIFFVVCAFFPNWLLIREKDEQFTLSSRKNIKGLLLCLVTPAIILIIYLYLLSLTAS